MSETTQDTKSTENSPPKWFNLAAIFALVWNLMGVLAFIGQITMTPEMIAELPQAEQALYASIPLWATIAFACAVFGGALGSLALLLKNPFAAPLFILSFVGVAVQMFHAFVLSNSFEVFGPGGTVMPMMVVVIAILLVYFAHKAKANNWLE